jgi:hypothetical protein
MTAANAAITRLESFSIACSSPDSGMIPHHEWNNAAKYIAMNPSTIGTAILIESSEVANSSERYKGRDNLKAA